MNIRIFIDLHQACVARADLFRHVTYLTQAIESAICDLRVLLVRKIRPRQRGCGEAEGFYYTN